MKQATNLTGKGVTTKKAPKSKVTGPLTQDRRTRVPDQVNPGLLVQPSTNGSENIVITVSAPSFEVKTRARANSKRASNENSEPKADHEDMNGSL